jgi:hypothetical protein
MSWFPATDALRIRPKPLGGGPRTIRQTWDTPAMRGGYNYNPACWYPRRMANFQGNDMLIFKQRFSKPSAIPSGDGLGEETGESL